MWRPLALGLLLTGCAQAPSSPPVAKQTEDDRLVARAKAREHHAIAQAESRLEALEDAKAVAIASAEAAIDNHDTLPGPADWKRLVGLNLDRSHKPVVERFVWTFKGGKLKDIKDMGIQELGYVKSDAGDGVAYADGSARTRSD